MEASRAAIIVPCFNESQRLPAAEFERFLHSGPPGIVLIFVDDGSRDSTFELLTRFQAACPQRAVALRLTPNRGKAEAVRYGIQYAFDRQFQYAGFWDADLATPLDAIPPFVDLMDSRPELDMVFGARVKLLGRHVERKASRHYLGRVFATAVSWVLALPVYDTQCGAKLFRSTSEMRSVFQQPFLSRWIFDVEIIARYGALLSPSSSLAQRIYEYPLQAWTDVGGSKLKSRDFFRAACDLFRIHLAYPRR